VAELAGIETVVFLQSVDLFRFCRAGQVLRLAGIAKERPFAAGETLYNVGDSAQTLYCVVRGGVEERCEDGSHRNAGPLTTVGVKAILSGRLRTAHTVASEETLTLAIDSEDFFDLLAHNIEIVKAIFRTLLNGGS